MIFLYKKVLEKVKNTNKEKDTIDEDLSESLWENRKTITKNLPQTNLSTILDMHKSSKYWNNVANKIHSINNDFEDNFKKVSK